MTQDQHQTNERRDAIQTTETPEAADPSATPEGPAVPAKTFEFVDIARISQELQIRKGQVEATVRLLDEGNTVPFITRYRKERTGGLDEEAIRAIQARANVQRQLAERKQTILKSIEGQGKLTPDLKDAILAAETSKRLEDLYLPYKPKKRSLATAARERGLENLALAIWNRDPVVAKLDEVLPGMINPEKELTTVDDVLAGVGHIFAEMIAETADVRAASRSVIWETGKFCSTKAESVGEGQALEYKDYFKFEEPLRRIPAHRVLAINRGEKANALKVTIEKDVERVRSALLSKLPLDGHAHADLIRKAAEDSLTRLLLPSLEREIRRELSDEAEDHAVRIFARNLKSLLMQPPVRGRRVLAIDPGFRTGCKIAALDEFGNLLEHGVIFPHVRPEKQKNRKPEKTNGAVEKPAGPAPPAAVSDAPSAPFPDAEQAPEPVAPQPIVAESAAAQATPNVEPPAQAAAPEQPSQRALARQESKSKIEEFVKKHQLNVIAIGNGTACRETEELVAELIGERLPELSYVIVNEAGASVYSASPAGREEFPDFDATLRGTISIGRRLQDPLSELVKIDPHNIGVGLYQHDVQLRRLKESLEAVVESCVNAVGVDVNTASVPLLRRISGLNQLAAREIVDYRKQNGPFKNRLQLQGVPAIGPARFVQSAGFLRITGGDNPLDETSVHPESYPTAEQIIKDLEFSLTALSDQSQITALRDKLRSLQIQDLSAKLQIGPMTLHDIVDALAKPGRDPREGLPAPVFKRGILKLEDLQPGIELKGTVLNVVDFGAFVDIGLKDSGLVHISQLANRFIKSAYDIVAVGDVVTVWVLAIDMERRRVSLTMLKPGTERKPPERRPEPRQEGDRPPPPPRRQPPRRAPASGQRNSAQQAPTPALVVKPPSRPLVVTPPPQRTHRPQRQAPKPKLSQAALEGAAPLRTFSELKAFFEAQKQPEPPPAKPDDGAQPGDAAPS